MDASSIIAKYEVNEVNQYTVVSYDGEEKILLTYDASGNLTFDGKNIYEWDARGRLSSAETEDGLSKWEYTYDSQNRRVAIETFTRESIADDFISEELMKFIYNDWLLIGELDSEGTMTRQYFYSDDANGDAGVGKLLGFTDYIGGIEGIIAPESKTYVVISDNVGNIIKVIDSQGTTMNKYAYSPFGELLVEQEQVTLNIGFNTKYEDESGLSYYNNRYYSHSLGRFISQDPIFEEGCVNLYSFTANDPLNHWDFLGTSTINVVVPGGVTIDGEWAGGGSVTSSNYSVFTYETGKVPGHTGTIDYKDFIKQFSSEEGSIKGNVRATFGTRKKTWDFSNENGPLSL